MAALEELRNATADLPAPELLRHLVLERFPNRCAVTSSLRARSVAVLKMIGDIDSTIPVIFCHAPYVYAESVDYRTRIVRRLGLVDVRDPAADETVVLPGDEDHYEEIRTSVWGGGEIESVVRLNASLADARCWISAAYHRPYADAPTPRLVREGRLVRVDPLSGWSREDVYDFMGRHNLPFHPHIATPTYHY